MGLPKTNYDVTREAMESVVVFETIQISEPRDKIFRRLGYRRGVTTVDGRFEETVDRDISYALSLIHLRGAALRLPIRDRNGSTVVCGQGIVFHSSDIAGMIRDCDELLIMGATAGSDIIDAIVRDSQEDRLTRGVVLDAVASEMADAALDWIVAYFNRTLLRDNRRVSTRRFSAGYGDFRIENQKVLFDILEMSRIGVRISDRFMLIPEKSVTAIAGIYGIFDRDEKGAIH